MAIPINWEMVQISDVCKKDSSNIAQKDLAKSEGIYPIFGASGFIKDIDFYQCENEYIGIVKDGAGVGRVMLLPSKSSVISTMQYLLPKDNVLAKYLYLIFISMDFSPHIKGSAIPHIYFKDYQFEQIFLPPLAEQRHIVERIESLFEKLDRAKELAQNVLDSFETRKAAILHKAFSGELTAKWRKENKIEKKTWRISNFSDVAEIECNLVNPKEYLEYPHIAPDNIEKRTGMLLEYNTIEQDGVTSGKHKFYK